MNFSNGGSALSFCRFKLVNGWAMSEKETGLVEKKIRYRLWLKLRVGKALATEKTTLTASVAGREVVIESEGKSQPLSEVSWLLIGCRGFEAEDDARDFGEKLRRAAHMAGLCARVGVDAGDPGEDRTVSWFNPEVLRESGALDPDTRLGPDIHGLLVLPDDGKTTLFVRMGPPTASVRSNAGDFVRALQDALSESDEPGGNSPSIRRAVRVLNLAEMNTDPIARMVLAVSTVEGLATDPPWTDAQRGLIKSAAAWLKRTHRDGEEVGQVTNAIRGIRRESIRQRIRKMLDSNDLSDLWRDWDALYKKRSRLFHGGRKDGSEELSDHLAESELNVLGQEALTLCGRIVLSIAKREGIPVPSRAGVHFGVE